MKRQKSPVDEGKSFAFGPVNENKMHPATKQKTEKERRPSVEDRLPAFWKVVL